MKPKNRSFFPSNLCIGLSLLSGVGTVSAANIYWDGIAGNWSDAAAWSTDSAAATPNPSAAPGSADVAIFNRTGSLGGVAVALNGNQSAMGIQFNNTSSMSLKASTANQVLSLGASGLTYGSGQVDLGGTGTGVMVISLASSQSWTGSGTGLIQLLNGAAVQGITNGTATPVTLTFAGTGTGSKTISAIIDDGILGGTTALTINTPVAFGTVGLNGNNTYSGGTTLTQGFLGINNALALGGAAGALTINGSAQTASILRSISSSVVGGVTLTNNNAQNWNADFTLGSAQSINFGTGAVVMGANTTIYMNPSAAAGTSLTNYVEGGNISGAFGLTVVANNPGATGYLPGINSQLTLNGTNSYTGGTTITSGLVKFGSTAAIPTGANKVVLNGGAISVSGAYSTLSGVLADTQVTKTQGALALVADSSENFIAPNAKISLGAALGSTAKYSGTITTSGNNYNLGGGGGTIIFTGTNAFTGAKSITTNGVVDNNIVGGGGTVIITGLNNASGNGATGVSIGQGTLQVDSIGSLNGAATNLGQFTTAANGTINFGASGNWSLLRYTGSGETTDRTLNWAGFSGANAGFDASGTGALNFSTTTFNQAAAASKNLTLRGINTGANTIVAGIGTSGTNNGSDALSKTQRGNWTLSGSNNISGLTINGGTLTADYTNVATVFTTSTPNLTLGGGALSIKGNAAGTTTQTLGNLTTSGNAGQNQITVTGNGSASTASLTLGNTFTRASNTYVNFNLLSGGTVTSAPTLTDGLIANTAAFTVTDSTGTDFATITGGKVAKLGAPGGALPTSVGLNTTNYFLSGSVTLAGSVAAKTVKIDTSTTGGTLTLGAFNVTGGTGEFLMSGANDYTISGTALGGNNLASPIGLSNYGAGKLTVAATVATGSTGLNKTGPGLVDLSIAQTFTGATNILGGVLRVSSTIGTGNISLNTGGIYEIGSASTFNRTVGTGTSQVQWGNGDGGFSAFGGNRTVALTNALTVTTGQLVWGSTNGNNFVTAPNASPSFVKDGFALLLGSSVATGTLDFQNPIDFVNMPRTVVVAKGAGVVAVDAILSGVLSSSDFSGGLFKTGTGTLALTAVNTYTGQTSINGGTVQLGNGGSTGSISTASVIVNNGTLAVNRTDVVTQGTQFSAAGLNGAGNFTQAGTGTTILNAANTYTGVTTASAGTLQFAKLNSLASNLNTKTTAASGATLAFNVGGTGEFAMTDITTILTNLDGPNAAGQGFQSGSFIGLDTTNASGATFTLADNLANSTGASGGAVGLTKLGTNALVLTGNNTYTGGTNLNAGTLNLGSAQSGTGGPLGGTGTVASLGIIKFGGGTMQFSAANQTDYSSRFSGSASQAFNIDTNGQNVTFGTALASTGGTLTKLGSGTLTITSSTNSYTGTTTISAGSLQLGNNGTTGSLATGSAIVNNGTLSFNRTNVVSQGTDFSNAAITGSGGIVQTGRSNWYNSILQLTAANTYSGTTTISNGTINVGANSILSGTNGPLGNATSSIILGDANTVAAGGAPNAVLRVTGVNNTTVQNYTINRNIDSSATANTSGRNDIGFENGNVGAQGTLTVSGNWSTATGANRGSGLWAGALPGQTGLTLDYTGVISGGNSLSSFNINDYGQGAGTVRLGNGNASNNTYAGATMVIGGTLLIAGDAGASSGALGTNSSLQMSAGGNNNSVTALTDGAYTVAKTITLNDGGAAVNWKLGGNQAVASTFSGAINTTSSTSNKTLSLSQVTGGTVTFSGVIGANAGTGMTSVDKIGAGTVVLSNINTYDGSTNVNAGKLIVSGSIASSAVTVSNADTILASDAEASIGTSLTINNGAILAAGDEAAAGTVTVGGATTFNDGSIFSWDINSTGVSYDKMITSAVTDGETAGNAVFRIVAADSTFADTFWNTTQTWTNIFTTNGSTAVADWANAFGSTVSLVDSGFNTIAPVSGAFTLSGSTLTWTAVPEPTSALAGLLIGAGLLRRRRA